MFELTVNKLVPTLATSIVAREGETTAIVTLSLIRFAFFYKMSQFISVVIFLLHRTTSRSFSGKEALNFYSQS